MSFITPPLERYSAKVSCRSKLSVVDDVYKKLDEEHKKLFLDSAFGKLYGIKENMNPSNVLLHVLVMLRIESPDENELWFCIGGQKVRFGLSDYTLITGLYSGDDSDFTKDIPTTKRLFNEYFEERKKAVRPEELKEAFSSAKSELDRYKLGLVVIYESVLRAKEMSTSIDTDFLNIVDNLELFNNYPWGRRSYPNLLTTMKKLSNKNGVKTNTFYGFPLAIQVWVFELFCNFLGFEDLYQLEKIGTEVPRMCNWKSTGNPSYEEIIEILDIHHDVALVPLVLNDVESCLRYVHGFPGTWCTIYTYSLEEQPTEEEVAPANDLMRVILDVVTSMQQKLNDNFIEINRKIDDRMIEMNQKINELVEARREQTPSHH